MNCFRLTLLSIFALLLSACQKDDDFEKKDGSGAVVKKSYKWEKEITNNWWSLTGTNRIPIYEDKYITATDFEGTPKLTAFNIYTGETEWEWGDFIGYDVNGPYLSLIWPYCHENQLIFQHGSRTYCIDMVAGQSIWKILDRQGYDSRLAGNGEEFLLQGKRGDTLGLEIHTDFIADVHTGERYPTPIPANFALLPDNISQYAYSTNGGCLFDANGKQYLLSSYAKVGLHWQLMPFIGLYNRTDSRWEYSEKQLLPLGFSNSFSNFPIVAEDVVVTTPGFYVFANDLSSGDSIWSYKIAEGGIGEGTVLIENGRVYVAGKPDNFYCFDLHSGKIIWNLKYDSIGHLDCMTAMNGIIYVANNGLMAIDMDSGKVLWNIECPDEWNFKEVVAYPGKDGQKPLVFATTNKHAYCYEAIQ